MSFVQSDTSQQAKKTFFNLLKLTVSISLLYYVFRDTDFVYLLSQLQQTTPVGLVSYAALSLFLVFMASFRWSLFLLDTPKLSEIFQFYKANIIALFYNLFLPTAYGGDLVKWTQLEALQLKKRTLIFSVFADRVIGVMGLITVGFFATLYSTISTIVEVPSVLLLFFSILFAGMLLGMAIIFTSIRASDIPLLKRFSFISELEDLIYRRKKRFFEMYLLAVVIQILSFVSFYLLALEAQLPIPFIYFLIISPVVSLISVLPISVAGFGTTEAAYLYFFTQLGATKETILVFMSLFGIFKILFGVIGWLTEFMVTSKNFSRATVKD